MQSGTRWDHSNSRFDTNCFSVYCKAAKVGHGMGTENMIPTS